MLKAGIVSQARMTSTRLPGKVLKTVQGKTLLQYHLDRLQKSGLPVIVATTTNETDQPIVDLCSPGIPVVRGSEEDVLSRFWQATQKFNFDIIVRVTSDCPLIDGSLIAEAVLKYQDLQTPWLYMSNCLERTYPRGFDFEIFSREMLQEAFGKAHSKPEREHVTPYFYWNQHGKTIKHSLTYRENRSSYRLTVDQKEDFELIEKLIIDHSCDQKNVDEICQVLVSHPKLAAINAHIEQKKL